jgi:hypothetical protein
MTFGRKPKPRVSIRETLTQNQKAMDGYAALMGKPTVSLGHIPDAPKPREKSEIPSEHSEQVRFVVWFRRQFPTVRIFAIPNGGSRGQIEAGRLRAEGVEPGVPDLYIPAWNCWVEMKRTEKYTVSADQVDWHAYLRALGDKVIVGIGCEDAKAKILDFTK